MCFFLLIYVISPLSHLSSLIICVFSVSGGCLTLQRNMPYALHAGPEEQRYSTLHFRSNSPCVRAAVLRFQFPTMLRLLSSYPFWEGRKKTCLSSVAQSYQMGPVLRLCSKMCSSISCRVPSSEMYDTDTKKTLEEGHS